MAAILFKRRVLPEPNADRAIPFHRSLAPGQMGPRQRRSSRPAPGSSRPARGQSRFRADSFYVNAGNALGSVQSFGRKRAAKRFAAFEWPRHEM